MSIEFGSFIWAFLQIAGVCTFALSIAWGIRGRHPQIITAMLAGTCLAAIALASVAIVPAFQWTLVAESRGVASVDAQSDSTPVIHDQSEQAHQTATSTEPPQTLPEVDAAPHNSASPARSISTLFAIREVLSQALEFVDLEVRQVEAWQRPMSPAGGAGVRVFLLIGLCAMALLWCSSWLYIRRILRSSREIHDADILSLVSIHANAFGLKRSPHVRESNDVPIGATVGWHQVTVLLHTDWKEWTEQERRAVIAHELAHASRHDFFWVVVASWTRILLFFHPFIHALIHRWRMEQELAADQLAAGIVGNAKAYGRALASLALRNEQNRAASNLQLSSMLTAGQICVTRRVMMLKQGSLKPIQTRSRWSMAIVIAIACAAIPVAGLRGTAQMPIEQTATAATVTDQASDQTNEAAKPFVPKPLSKEFLAEFPPLEFKGSLVYRPGRLRAGEFGAEAAWIQEMFTVSLLGRPMPDNATVYAELVPKLRWLDEERQHGALDISASFREGESTIPGQIGQLSKFSRMVIHPTRKVSTQQLNGRTISGVTASTTNDQPENWLVDDSEGYFLGSLDDAKRFILGRRFALSSIPESFREDYTNAAFAVVFNDCEQWPDRLEAHVKGSPKEVEFQLVRQFIEGAKQIGLFIDGCKSPACMIRASMADSDAANRVATQAKALAELAKLATLAAGNSDEKPTVDSELNRSFFETLKVTTHSSEVRFEFDLFAPSLDSGAAMQELSSIVGWQNINAAVLFKDADTPYVEVMPGDVAPTLPSLFSQTLDASNYRGKTITLEMELQCHEDSQAEAGAFIWASRQEAIAQNASADRKPLRNHSPYAGHRMLAARTIACDGVATFRDAWQTAYRVPLDPAEANWRTVAVRLEVPHDAQHLSFGCYSKIDLIRVRNVKLRTVAPADASAQQVQLGTDASADLQYNILIFPGQVLHAEPQNLGFTEVRAESLQQASKSNPDLR